MLPFAQTHYDYVNTWNDDRTDQSKKLILTKYIKNSTVGKDPEIRKFFNRYDITVNS